ncbi:MAG: serine hydrolase [Chitinophagaceae bacterium]|jgi:CubicO group peptidase (beta-lactamase class C family)|nr:serine hydrolase [Chitinophagaceae bacterium]MCE2972402.1 beta-lactamase family protein [Sediminibacterium sp.]
MKFHSLLALLLSLWLTSCTKTSETTPVPTTPYFPPITGNTWETVSPASLNWNATALQDLKTYLQQKGTKAFIILVNGRIVVEEYMNGHTPSASWPWNSAGKTLTTATIGIAQQQGILNIQTRVSQYLGNGWTTAPTEKENLITLRHLLTMSSGLNDASELVTPNNLSYLADAGTRWSYHNVFQKLMDVVTVSSGQDFRTYFANQLRNKIGMEGEWNYGLIFKIYHSNARSMARFGLLALNQGKWNNESIVSSNFFNESTTTSQQLNPSYGYLWWLNGKNSAMLPGSQVQFPGPLVPNAPADTFLALGKDDQKIYVVPSQKMVVIRMGEAADQSFSLALSGFDNTLWAKIKAVMP